MVTYTLLIFWLKRERARKQQREVKHEIASGRRELTRGASESAASDKNHLMHCS
jgi:hypothetical protein